MSAPNRSLSDEELVARFVAGDADAFSTLLDRYRTPIFNFILRSVRRKDRAEDLMQEVFLRVVERVDRFEGSAKFSTWLFAIARNLCIDESRRMIHRRHPSLDAPAHTGDDGSPAWVEAIAGADPGAARETIGKQLRGRLVAAVDALPEDQREVFLLRQLQQMSFKEIAEVVGAPENTVKSRMRYALERLQEELLEYADYAAELR